MLMLRPALAALMIGVAAPAFIAPAFAQTCACPQVEGFQSGPVIQADEAPPPLPVYEQPPIPSPGYVWTPGYWAWNNYDFYWVPGVWVEPAQTGLLWTPGYWAFVGGAYLFHQGYWGQHVGFYGGVNYGYGYNGLGYQGGRWEGNRFVYNTTVNNFGSVRVTNVYTETVTARPGAARVSYNGGPGGIALKPTPEQERLTTEAHVEATPQQVSQARTASMEGTQFRSVNQGKPAVAATERPGELKGPGVVPAKAAGSAELHEGTSPNGEEKREPGVKPPAGAPAELPRANLNEKPPAPSETGPGQRLKHAEPVSPPRPEERPAQVRPLQERPAQERPTQERPAQERPAQERRRAGRQGRRSASGRPIPSPGRTAKRRRRSRRDPPRRPCRPGASVRGRRRAQAADRSRPKRRSESRRSDLKAGSTSAASPGSRPAGELRRGGLRPSAFG